MFNGARTVASLGVFLVAVAAFGVGLDLEPYWVDESAYVAQTYYYRLASSGDLHHPDWIHPASYDHLQVPKYVMGLALSWTGQRDKIARGTGDWEYWISGHWEKPNDRQLLLTLRWSMLLGSALGCAMAFAMARQLGGTAAGLLAALFLGASPLYYTHARRAMSDDLTQALVLASLCAFITWVERRNQVSATINRDPVHRPSNIGESLISFMLVVLSGTLGGLATGCKLNGVVAPATLLLSGFALTLAALATSTPKKGRRHVFGPIVAGGGAFAAAAAVFVAVNPYFYAHPSVPQGGAHDAVVWGGRRRSPDQIAQMKDLASQSFRERAWSLFNYRSQALDEGMDRFPHDALRRPRDRILPVLTQGLGRWTFLGRWIPAPWSALLFGAATAWGIVALATRGRRSDSIGALPSQWVVLVWGAVEVAMLLRGLTLDWDRYYLGIVAWGSVVAGLGVADAAGRLYSLVDRGK